MRDNASILRIANNNSKTRRRNNITAAGLPIKQRNINRVIATNSLRVTAIGANVMQKQETDTRFINPPDSTITRTSILKDDKTGNLLINYNFHINKETDIKMQIKLEDIPQNEIDMRLGLFLGNNILRDINKFIKGHFPKSE